METVGEFFRQVRETKGLTLDAVASKTCIHPDFLRALEDNNFAKLPDQVFAKGFVRSYARSLGLDESDAMRRFLESAGPFYEKQGEREELRQKQIEDERRRVHLLQALADARGHSHGAAPALRRVSAYQPMAIATSATSGSA